MRSCAISAAPTPAAILALKTMYFFERGRALVYAARWALGFPSENSSESSTGFDMQSLVPERQRTLAERGIALLTSLTVAFMLFGWILI